jgi:hypothetical protein
LEKCLDPVQIETAIEVGLLSVDDESRIKATAMISPYKDLLLLYERSHHSREAGYVYQGRTMLLAMT